MGFEPFRPLKLAGYRTKPSNNIYFFSARRFGHLLLGLYPAVIEDRGGIWCSTSDLSGEQWTRPLRVWESAIVTQTRTRDWPVEFSGLSSDDAAADAAVDAAADLRIVIEHDVHISLGGPTYFKTLCINASVPRVCEYHVDASPSSSREAEGGDLCARIARVLKAEQEL